ncbi:hypothetical protein PoB_002385900 [Plakobranchus ocellatus]|uniref:RNase H type-1 domain-containing protein n=1 Tax=Plakobranchus ocellatus TaxID=259542 RepID=A0AAV3ZSH2_9GAST|nr:hypothetical protein PoB_002385900 [Plakobranchus ocellatus]
MGATGFTDMQTGRRNDVSYDCELMAVTECLRVVIRRQREGAALPGLAIFTDCRALVQALGGSGSEIFGGAVLFVDNLQKTERVWPWSNSFRHMLELAEGHSHSHGNH